MTDVNAAGGEKLTRALGQVLEARQCSWRKDGG